MRLKKTVFIMLSAGLLFLTGGCWDAMDVNDKALITLVVLDRQDEQYVFHVEVPNLSFGHSGGEGGGAGGGYEQYSFVSGAGDTLVEARQNLDYKMDKPIFLGTIRSLVITEEMAKYGIDEYMYRLKSDDEYRKRVGIVTTSVNLEALLDNKPENNTSIGYSIDDMITTLDRDGRKLANTTSDVLEFLASDRCFLLPDIGLDDGDIICTGYTIFHNGKHNGSLSPSEAKGAVWIAGKHPQWFYVVPFGDYEATVEVTRKSKNIKPFYSQDILILDLSFEFESRLMYLSKDVVLDSEKEEQIKQNLKKMLLKDIADAVEKSKSAECDYLGFQDAFRIHYPNELKKMSCWCDEYASSQVKISVRTSLEPGGLGDFETTSKQKSTNEEGSCSG